MIAKDELTVIADLSTQALKILQELGKNFIASCFNRM